MDKPRIDILYEALVIANKTFVNELMKAHETNPQGKFWETDNVKDARGVLNNAENDYYKTWREFIYNSFGYTIF